MKLPLTTLCLVALLGGTRLFADIVLVGDIQDIGSFTARFARRGVDDVDEMRIQMLTPGITFTAGGRTTGFDNFSVSGWDSYTADGGRRGFSSGPGANEIQFNLLFSANRFTTSFGFFFEEHHRGALIDRFHIGYDNDHGCFNINHVPEASTLVLRAGWLLGLGLLMIRRKALVRRGSLA